jgi:predicted NUDIX family NTP pyrophosphohydrolase
LSSARRNESAGLLLFRASPDGVEVLLVHPGGPYWAKKDAGVWSVPKGEPLPDEEPLAAARREVLEEIGLAAEGPFLPLGEVRQKAGKRVTAWAARAEFDPAALRSATFEMEWPPRSGRRQAFPEVDRAAWFGLDEARARILEGQRPLLDALERALAAGPGAADPSAR